MLEMFIVKELMTREGRDLLVRGTILGYSVAHIQKTFGIPKPTFYRAVNSLIESGSIVKQKRGYYAISDDLRLLCNGIKDAEKVGSIRVKI